MGQWLSRSDERPSSNRLATIRISANDSDLQHSHPVATILVSTYSTNLIECDIEESDCGTVQPEPSQAAQDTPPGPQQLSVVSNHTVPIVTRKRRASKLQNVQDREEIKRARGTQVNH